MHRHHDGLKTAALLGTVVLVASFLLFGRNLTALTIGLVIALAVNLGTCWFSDTVAMKAMRARPVTEQEQPGGVDRDRGGSPIGATLMLVLGPLAAGLVQMAISRTREYDADEDGARLTDDPLAPASALSKLERGVQARPLAPEPQLQSASHLMIANPFSARDVGRLLSTHPPMAQRIARLEAMAGARSAAEADRVAPAFRIPPSALTGSVQARYSRATMWLLSVHARQEGSPWQSETCSSRGASPTWCETRRPRASSSRRASDPSR